MAGTPATGELSKHPSRPLGHRKQGPENMHGYSQVDSWAGLGLGAAQSSGLALGPLRKVHILSTGSPQSRAGPLGALSRSPAFRAPLLCCLSSPSACLLLIIFVYLQPLCASFLNLIPLPSKLSLFLCLTPPPPPHPHLS